MDVGETVEVEIGERHDGYLKAERDGSRFSIAGEGSIGDTRKIRIVKNQGGPFIAVTEGATLRLRIDEVVDESTVRADPSYGPVLIEASLSPGDWWQCVVTGVQESHVTAKPRKYIPRNSDIPRGDLPDDSTQSLNHLLSGRKL
ncbi:hypothetical protein [Halobacterium wangiae]|uniref:hypothetical protein n=1 Tax=Halobacterium wangiae TaxID=2902623 RepID=UPI001E2E5386|nr:hypothetical protein [Halobacterium wangiae]